MVNILTAILSKLLEGLELVSSIYNQKHKHPNTSRKKTFLQMKKIIHYTWRVTMCPKDSFLEQVTIKAALKDDHCQDFLKVYIQIMTLLSFFQWSKTRCDLVKRTLCANPTQWLNTLKSSSAFASALFECIWPFCGVSTKRVKKNSYEEH